MTKILPRRFPILVVALAAGLMVPAMASRANDGFGALGAGGIVIGHTGAIAMASEVLEIGYRRIDVDYQFVNESDADVTETISFPLPPYPANPEESGVIYNGPPADFTVRVNNREVAFTTRVWAVLDGKDITDRLKALGFSEKQIALVPFEKSVSYEHKLTRPPEVMKALKAASLVDEDGGPLWKIHVAYEWRQTFPAHKPVEVHHNYRPFIAGGTDSGYSGAESDNTGDTWLKKEFCADQPLLEKMHALYAIKENFDPFNEVPGTIVEYVLTTGNTWKDGIRDFTLKISKGSPYELVSLCYDGPIKRVNGLTLESHIKDFHPKSDLKIYFGNAWYAEMPGPNIRPVFKAAPGGG